MLVNYIILNSFISKFNIKSSIMYTLFEYFPYKTCILDAALITFYLESFLQQFVFFEPTRAVARKKYPYDSQFSS